MILSNTDQKYYTDDLKETEGSCTEFGQLRTDQRFLGIARVFIETEGSFVKCAQNYD